MNQRAAFNQALGTEGLFAPLQSALWGCSKEGTAALAAHAAASLLLPLPCGSTDASLTLQ